MSNAKAAFKGMLLTALWMFAFGLGPSMSHAEAAFKGLLLTALGMFALSPHPLRLSKAALLPVYHWVLGGSR